MGAHRAVSSGSVVGYVVAAPLIAILTIKFGWRAVFLFPGLLGLVWLATHAIRRGDGPADDWQPGLGSSNPERHSSGCRQTAHPIHSRRHRSLGVFTSRWCRTMPRTVRFL